MKDTVINAIRSLRPVNSLFIKGTANRSDYLRTAKILKKMGKIKFDVVTKARRGGFVVAAI